MNIMCTAIINLVMQHYKKGHATQTLRLLLNRSINSDTLSTKSWETLSFDFVVIGGQAFKPSVRHLPTHNMKTYE